MRNKIKNTAIRPSYFKSILSGMMASAMALLLSSCDVHQFPEPKSPEPELPTRKIRVPLKLVYNPYFYVWEHYYDPVTGKIREQYPDAMEFPNHPATTSQYDNTLFEGVIEIHIKAYAHILNGACVYEKSMDVLLQQDGTYDTDVEIELPVDTEYTLAVWSQLREEEGKEPFYTVTDFNKVGVIPENYVGNNDYRDGFSGTIEMDTYIENYVPYIVPMTRPMGKFEFVTIDLSEFLERETTRRSLATRATADEYIVVVSFPMYYPSSYSVLEDRLENASSGVSFKTNMTVTGVSEASLGFEYVMLNDNPDAGVQARVDIYDPSYTHVAGSTTLTIPMQRDRHTVLRGEFLSQEGEGGVGIDPGFNGDHNVIW